MAQTTWQQAYEKARAEVGDTSPLVALAGASDVMERPFDDGYGGSQGPPVTVWTEERVYFPVVYDGAEWMGSAPRDPSGEALRHVGGE